MGTRDYTRSNWQAEAGVRAPLPGERPAGWGSLLVFAGVMLAVVGLFQAMTGLTAMFNDEILVVRSDSLIVSLDYTYWGWAGRNAKWTSMFTPAMTVATTRPTMFPRSSR